MIFGEVKLKRTRFEIPAETKQRKNKKTGEVTEVTVYERFNYPAPYAYDIRQLRKKLKKAFQSIANGAKKVELVLYRYPQVHTVVGEMRAMFPKLKLTAGWTTDDELNTLFVVERVR